MLSASAYSFRLQSRLAISLSWIAGYTNVVTFIICSGVVVSHTTGNVTHFAEQFATGEWRSAVYFGFLVTMFFFGAAGSALLTELARRRGASSKYILPVAVQAILLCAMALLVELKLTRSSAGKLALPSTAAIWWLTGLGSLAMGIQNATITKVSGATVRTTHLTGVVTDIGIEGVQLLLWWRDLFRSRKAGRAGRVLRVSQRHPSVLRVLLLASIFGSFLFGAVAGTLVYSHWPRAALLAPVAFLLWIILVTWMKPIADLRELDATADSEFVSAGLTRSLLPPEVGIYRLYHRRTNRPHHAPDFAHWADRLPKRWRVVIVAVSPWTHFDVDEAMSLRAAAKLLLTEHRRLVVCGLSQRQYRALANAGVTDAISRSDMVPDIEFAIARAVDLLESTADVARLHARR